MSKYGTDLETWDKAYIPNLYPNDKREKADRNATLDDVTSFIYLSLIDFQGKFIQDTQNSWWVTFPNVWEISVGDIIKNISTGESYKVSQFVDEAAKKVELSGFSPPGSSDTLEIEESNSIRFTPAYPPKEVTLQDWRDTITYKVSKRQPGSISPHPFEQKKEIKPRLREIIRDKDNPGHHIFVQGQWFDNLIQFDCWAQTNHKADQLISWFEDFLFKYTWVWKKNGVQEILYWERTIDETITKWKNNIVNRTLFYYFRTEKITVIRTNEYSQIDLQISVSPGAWGVITPSGLAPSGITEIEDQGLVVPSGIK